MYYLVETNKSFDQVSKDLEIAAQRRGVRVLHVHDLGATLRGMGVSFHEECRVFEICNPKQAAEVLSQDTRLNMVLPCRFSVFTGGGKTKVALLRPTDMLASLSREPDLQEVAEEVEATTIEMIDAALQIKHDTGPRS